MYDAAGGLLQIGFVASLDHGVLAIKSTGVLHDVAAWAVRQDDGESFMEWINARTTRATGVMLGVRL